MTEHPVSFRRPLRNKDLISQHRQDKVISEMFRNNNSSERHTDRKPAE